MDDAGLLGLLQLADSAFPSGAYVLSGGLETLIEEKGISDAAGLAGSVRAMLLGRAARGDLVALVAAHRAARAEPPEARTILEIDRRLDATKLAEEERIGSRRVGRRIAIEAERVTRSPALATFGEAIQAAT